MIDILHPAHVHFFRNAYFELRQRGHEVLVTARQKDCALALLDKYGIPYELISTSTRGLSRQAFEFLDRTRMFVRLAHEFRPDLLAGIMGPTIALAGRWLKVPSYVFYDTEFAQFTNRVVYPLATKVITPDCYQGLVGHNHVTYPGYHELAYLHPNRFTPDAEKVRAVGIDPQQPYSVVRFVGFWATHDRHERGLSPEQKSRVVRELQQYGPVVVTSEADAPAEIADCIYRGPVEDVHHLLHFASLYYGESATMASESAVLGTPAIYIATSTRGYTDDLARYGLVHDYRDEAFEESVAKANTLLSNLSHTQSAAAAAQAQMLSEKIDVTEYISDIFAWDLATEAVAGLNTPSVGS